MSVAGIGTSGMQGVSGVAGPPLAPTTSSAGRLDTDGDADGGRVRVSPRAQFLSNLQSLAKTDPAKAKQMLTDLEGTMRSRAAEAGGARGAQLSQLADRIHQAATTGDYSSLMPSSSSGGSRGAAYHAANASTWSSR